MEDAISFLLRCLRADSAGTFILLGKGWEGGEGIGADGSVSLRSLVAFHTTGSESSVSGWHYYRSCDPLGSLVKEVILQSHSSGLYERV